MQKLLVIGRLGSDPEMKYTGSGQAVVNVSVAVDEHWTDKDSSEKRKRTTWYRWSAWGRAAETINQYAKKGERIFFEGRLNPDEKGNPRTFTRTDGTPGASYEATVREFEFLGGNSGRIQNGTPSGESQPGGGEGSDTEDEFPF